MSALDGLDQVARHGSRLHLHAAADELEGLLEVASPGPWRDRGKYGAVVTDTCTRGCDAYAVKVGVTDPGWSSHPHDGYDGCLVAESMHAPDRALLVAMRHAVDHLPALLRAIAEEDPIAAGRAARAIAATTCPCDGHGPDTSPPNDMTRHPPMT